MITQVDATYADGVLKPDTSLPLAEKARVHLTIEAAEPWSADRALQALRSIEARLVERPIHGGGVRYTRDELHERR